MARLTITDDDIARAAATLGLDPTDLDAQQRKLVRRHAANNKLPAEVPQKAPSKLTITTEISLGDRIISVSQQHVPLPQDINK